MKIRSPYVGYVNVTISTSTYTNGNLAIMLWCEDGPFAKLTTNLGGKLKPGYAYVDTNTLPYAEEFIEKYQLGEFADEYKASGFCMYPLYKFDMEALINAQYKGDQYD